MGFRAFLRSAEPSEPERYDLFSVMYRAPVSGALLDVEHDMAALEARSGDTWKALFDRRRARAPWPLSSGVWSKLEWVLPEAAHGSLVSLGEGNTPLLPVPELGRRLGVEQLHLKQCGTTHTGSFKDLGMTVLVSAVVEMKRRGVPIRAVACASTGDTSAALAAYGAAAGVPTVVFLPKGKITPAQLVQPLAHGAHVLELDTDFDGCMRLVKAVTENPDCGLYLANSMNPLRIEGQKTVAIEIAQDLDWQSPDWVVIPGGNLGNVSALGAGFDMMFRLGLIERRPRLAVAQAQAANPLFRAYQTGFQRIEPMVAGPTVASAIRIGDPVSMPRAIRALRAADGVVEEATEAEIHEAAAGADRTGLFTCPHTAVALASLKKLIAKGVIDGGARVVVVSTAHGLKFTDFKAAYHAGDGGPLSNPPETVAGDVDAIRRALDRRLGHG